MRARVKQWIHKAQANAKNKHIVHTHGADTRTFVRAILSARPSTSAAKVCASSLSSPTHRRASCASPFVCDKAPSSSHIREEREERRSPAVDSWRKREAFWASAAARCFDVDAATTHTMQHTINRGSGLLYLSAEKITEELCHMYSFVYYAQKIRNQGNE